MDVEHLFDHAQHFQKLGMMGKAENIYREVLKKQPTHIKSMGNLAILLEEKGAFDEAESLFKSILKHWPHHELTLRQLAKLYRHSGRVSASIAILESILKNNPSIKAQWDLSFSYLLNGDFEKGWLHFDSRILLANLPLKVDQKKYWDGEINPSKTLLIIDEQGIGDSLQFLRFIPEVLNKPFRKVIFYGKPMLKSLMNKLFPEIEFICKAEEVPEYDLYVPLMSLAKVFKVYLPEKIVNDFSLDYVSRLELRPSNATHKKPIVALCWQGNRHFKGDKFRSPGLKTLLPLLKIQNVEFVSVQVGPARQQIHDLGVEGIITDLGNRIETERGDVLTTLKLLYQCDFVVTSDTSVAHMAGILGKLGYVLLSSRPDWRWLTDTEHSFWYPSLKLMRQAKVNQWKGVVELIIQDIENQSASKT
ncbi:tetratricopeptide repeat protein [Marinomonas ostreistagni]|uniref:Tetratricopeptide repeat protein n=1 Tax=Marinomonas ostreistagni TaxID=359209 RepID=A0ABS0ZFI2_9GAMM|nr:tetratricopeptide repeat protein [Marinomonas ostreistagni]MBJ7552382.1 tetratricopeptide repeat protein [Marinomonas ostreistagni]